MSFFNFIFLSSFSFLIISGCRMQNPSGNLISEKSTISNFSQDFYLEQFRIEKDELTFKKTSYTGAQNINDRQCHAFGVLEFKKMIRAVADLKLKQHEDALDQIENTYTSALKFRGYFESQNTLTQMDEQSSILNYPFDELHEQIILDLNMERMWWFAWGMVEKFQMAGLDRPGALSANAEQRKLQLVSLIRSQVDELVHEIHRHKKFGDQVILDSHFSQTLVSEISSDLEKVVNANDFFSYFQTLNQAIQDTRFQLRRHFPELNLILPSNKLEYAKVYQELDSDEKMLEAILAGSQRLKQHIKKMQEKLPSYPKDGGIKVNPNVPIIGGSTLFNKEEIDLHVIKDLVDAARIEWDKLKSQQSILECESIGVDQFYKKIEFIETARHAAALISTGVAILLPPPLNIAAFATGATLSAQSAVENFEHFGLARTLQQADGNFGSITPNGREEARRFLIAGGLDLLFTSISSIRLYQALKATTFIEMSQNLKSIRAPSLRKFVSNLKSLGSKNPRELFHTSKAWGSRNFCALRSIRTASPVLRNIDYSVRTLGRSLFIGSLIGTASTLANASADPYAIPSAISSFLMSIPMNELWCRTFGAESSLGFVDKMLVSQGFSNTIGRIFEVAFISSIKKEPGMSFMETLQSNQALGKASWYSGAIYSYALSLVFWNPHFHSTSSSFPLSSENVRHSIVKHLTHMRNGSSSFLINSNLHMESILSPGSIRTLAMLGSSGVHFAFATLQRKGSLQFRKCALIATNSNSLIEQSDQNTCFDFIKERDSECLKSFVNENCKQAYRANSPYDAQAFKKLNEALESAELSRAESTKNELIYIRKDEQGRNYVLVIQEEKN